MSHVNLIETFRVNNNIKQQDYMVLPCNMGARKTTWYQGGHQLTYYCFKSAHIDATGLVNNWKQVDGCSQTVDFENNRETSYECK